MLKTCLSCNKLFKGESELCKSCSKDKEKNSIISCKKCGKLSGNTINGLCKDCLKTTMTNFQIIKHYIYENPNATISKVHEALDIPKKEILNYVRKGRLEVKKDLDEFSLCKNCGIKIPPKHSLCFACKKNIDIKKARKKANKTIKKKRNAFFTN
ncbi:MAG: hypothetical protein ACQEQE_05460 [Bacillota bacterium]